MMKGTIATLLKVSENWSKGSLVIARGEKTSSLYTMRVKLCGEINTVECNSTDLWHLHLDHMSEKWLQILAKRDCLPH